MAGLLDFLGLGDFGGGGGLLGNLGGALGQATDNPLFHAGLGMLSGQNLQHGFGNALAAMNAKQKDAEGKALYQAFLQMRQGGQGGTPMLPAMATGMPGGPSNAPPLAQPTGAPPQMPPGPTASTGGGSAFGGLPGWAPGERPIDAGPAPSPTPPAPTGPMVGAGAPPPMLPNNGADVNQMFAIMAHPSAPEPLRKSAELVIANAFKNGELTTEQKNYAAYYAQARAAGGSPVGIEKFMAMPRHAPSMTEVFDPDTGQPVKGSFNPMTEQFTRIGGVKDIAGGRPAEPIMPGTNVAELNKRRADATVTNEEDAVKSAKAAAEFKPLIDQAVNAYQKAMDAGAIGPYVASTPGRMGGKYITKSEHEALRQDYDKVLSAVQARITAAQNKGEGAVSNFERQMYAAQFPDLSAINPKGQLNNLRQIQSLTHETVGIGKTPGIGQAPVVQQGLDRASTFGGPKRLIFNPATGRLE